MKRRRLLALLFIMSPLMDPLSALAFEGQVHVTLVQGAQSDELLYTAATHGVRIEVLGSPVPNPVTIVERPSGVLTVVFPHNRSFARLNSPSQPAIAGLPGFSGMPQPPAGLPPGIGPSMGVGPTTGGVYVHPGGSPLSTMPATPQTMDGLVSNIGLRSLHPMPAPLTGIAPMASGTSPAPAPIAGVMGEVGVGRMQRARMPLPPPMMNRPMALSDTGVTTNLLGFACRRFELDQRGVRLEVWATDQLMPYQAYLRHQPMSPRPQVIDELWPDLLAARHLFPLVAVLRYDNGVERLRLTVTSISTNGIAESTDTLFQPPPGYREMPALPY